MGSMKEKNRWKWRPSGRRRDRHQHGSEIRGRYGDPPHDEAACTAWRSGRGHDGSGTDRRGGLLGRVCLRAKDRHFIGRSPGREKRCTGNEEEIRSHTPILRESETDLVRRRANPAAVDSPCRSIKLRSGEGVFGPGVPMTRSLGYPALAIALSSMAVLLCGEPIATQSP